MQFLISALGIIISALIALPSATVALNNIEKSKVSHALLNLSELLDSVITRGKLIVSNLDLIAKNSTKEDVIETKEELLVILKSQMKDLQQIMHILQHDLYYGNNLVYSYLTKKRSKVPKILKVYMPRMLPVLHIITGIKLDLLTALMEILHQQIEGFTVNKYYIREV